jgi:RNA polymerase sigma-70 factor (ECF subfamily)
MTDVAATDAKARRAARGTRHELEAQLEGYRTELTGHCYRMLGGAFEAEDAVQETMVRAWRALDRFEGRSALRSWLYSIATNVCFDMLGSKQRRARPMDLGPASSADTALGAPLVESTWVEPIPDPRVVPQEGDPAELAAQRETVRLAFIAALQQLPARQRAVLILREVLRWKAAEVAELLDTTVASVNSALQRARATLADSDLATTEPFAPMDDDQQTLLGQYVSAFEQYDIDALISLIEKDAAFSMPPYALWLRGHDDISRFYVGQGAACRGSRLIPTAASGLPAFGHYKPSSTGSGYEPWALQVIEISAGRIVGLHHFLDTERMFPLFGLPPRLDG